MDSEILADSSTDSTKTLTSGAPDDASSIVADIFSKASIKKYFIWYILFILVSSDVFITSVISRLSINAVQDDTLTNQGTLIQGMVLVLLYIVLDIVISQKYL